MIQMTSFTVHELTNRSEFDAVVEVEWTAMHEPFRPEFPWLHPVLGYTEEDRLASIKADADRRWQSHKEDKASHWIYVTDDTNGKVVGATEWQVYTENPFPDGPVELECTWFPEGETRDFVTSMINQFYYARMNWMDRPHISLNAMAVIPSMRRHGIGSMMMRWGLQKADELNLECFLEASNLGRALYEKFDFRILMSFGFNMHKDNPSQTWIRLQSQFRPVFGVLMWRPKPEDLLNGSKVSFWDILKGKIGK